MESQVPIPRNAVSATVDTVQRGLRIVLPLLIAAAVTVFGLLVFRELVIVLLT